MDRKNTGLVAGLGIFLSTLVTSWGEQIVFSEIMYHPRGEEPEYLELYNNTATPFDIARWRLTSGVSYEFPGFDPAAPQASFLKPFERLVLTGGEPAAARQAYDIPPSVRVFGPWNGKLANGGDQITLKDKNGVVVCAVSYNDRGKWPPAADGAGHSLVLKDPNRAVDDWRNWTASPRPGGTPGTEPMRAAETPAPNPEADLSQGITVVDYGDTWKYHDQGVDLGDAWMAPDYDDGGWPQGPGLFGFETASLPAPGLRTSLANSRQLTYYLRKPFVYNGDPQNAVITVDQVLDDGAIYYLNGTEIGRSGMAAGVSGFGATANRTVSNASEELEVFPVNAARLVSGVNTLAVEVHQVNASSSDVVFGLRLKVAVPGQSQSGVVINEVLPGAAGKGFIEFFNPGATAASLGGFYLSDTPEDLRKFRISPGLVVPARGFASVGFAESGLSATNPVAVYLIAPDGTSVESGIRADMPLDGRSLGRKPAGGDTWYHFIEPTRDGPNQSQDSANQDLKLNELHFSASNTVDWVELFNAASTPLPVEGLYLSARRDFSDRVALIGEVEGRGFMSLDTAFPLEKGEITLYLVNAANTVLDARVFARVPGLDSVQAFPDGSSEWYSAPAATRGAANDPPRQEHIVINEMMYNPPSGQLDGEYIELYNRGTQAVDVSGWRFTDGPDFTLPQGTTIPAGGYLVCAANAAWMRRVYGDIPVVGDFQGRMADRGELVRLVDQFGNLADEVDYSFGGDWPELAHGRGSSLELANPWLDNRLPSAWRDSDETNRAPFQTYSVNGVYQQMNSQGGAADFKELNLHLANDGYAVLRNIALRRDGTGPNLIVHGADQSTTGSGATGWLCQGTHAASFVSNGELHLIADGHGDNRANRAEIDITNITANTGVTLSFEARWVHGSPRLIAETWDHSVGQAFRLAIPENLGTPGAVNSRHQTAPPPQVDTLRHSPAVPRSSQEVKITVRVSSASPMASVLLFHRVDNANGNAAWSSKLMSDDGLSGGDVMAGDGLYTATLTEHQVNGRVVQFYVSAEAENGEFYSLPKYGASRPALYVVDDRTIPRDLRTARFIVSAYDLDAISNGNTAKHQYWFPRLSNHYKNMTFISNEDEIRYGGLIRNSGSPWTRGGNLSRGKWKLPEDRAFRNHVKFTFDNDPTAGRMHHNRITRYLLYLLGHPANENEFIRVMINAGSPELREDTEPAAKNMLDRLFENGSQGELYRIDDEWWFRDNWERSSRNADWSYKNSESPIRYHTEWMKRTLEDDYDYSALINLFRTVSTASYTQQQIERLVDPAATLQMAAVRGYIGDWDSFTLNRGKNGYFYRRWSDGKFMFLHWDSDLAFQNSSETLYNASRPGIGPYLSKPYNLRRFYYYLSELLDHYTLNSPRMEAWLRAEEEASPSYGVAANVYRNWFSSRLSYCRNRMGANATLPFEIATNAGQPLATTEHTISLSGQAPYSVFRVEVEGQPEAAMVWNGQTAWTLSGIRLRDGANTLNLRGVDQWGKVVHQASLMVIKTGNAPPVMALQTDPDSWRLPLESALQLDARGSFDPEGSELNFQWSPPAGLASFQTNPPGLATAAFARPGLYPFTVQAADAHGQLASMSREFSVYGPHGFSSFKETRLESFWNPSQVDYRDNYPEGAWLSLADVPGSLLLQALDSEAHPLGDPAQPYPLVWRALPATQDWAFQTKLTLASRQFGDYLTGLHLEVVETNTTHRYVFGCENGTLLSVKRVSSGGAMVSLTSVPLDSEEQIIRARREGDHLIFEQRMGEVWSLVLTQPLAPGARTARGGLFLATGLPQSIRVLFEYALVVDPASAATGAGQDGLIHIASPRAADGMIHFDFTARAGRTYSVLSCDGLTGSTWRKLRDIAAEPEDRLISISEPTAADSGGRFYRVVAPHWPE